jgi:hypothetical protein
MSMAINYRHSTLSHKPQSHYMKFDISHIYGYVYLEHFFTYSFHNKIIITTRIEDKTGLLFFHTQKYSKYNETLYTRQLVIGFSFQRTGLDPRAIHAKFVEDVVVVGHVSARILRFYPCHYNSNSAP